MITETAVLQKPKPATRRKKKKPAERQRLEPGAVYSRKDAAAIFGCHPHTLMRAYLAGRLQGSPVGRLVYHTAEQISSWWQAGGKTA